MRQLLPLWSESKSFLFVEAALVFLFHYAMFWWIFGLSSLPIGGDGYFHYTIASQLNASNLYQSIEALPFTLLGQNGPDLHWLIHWLQKPFTLLFPDTVSGFALATIAWGAMVPTLTCATLRAHKVPLAALIAAIGVWSLYLLPDRLLMFRAQNAAIIMVIVLTLLMSAQRYIWVGVFIFIFNHAYQGVVLAGAVGCAALLSHALVYKKFDRLLISASLIGVLLSLVTSPWFPDNIRYFFVVMMGRIFSPFNNESLMGVEWWSLPLDAVLEFGLVGHVCLLLCSLILFTQWRKQAGSLALKRALTFTVLTYIFLAFYAWHWRMGEFYGPVSAVSLGFCLLLVKGRIKWLIPAIVFIPGSLTIAHQLLDRPKITPVSGKYIAQCEYLNAHAHTGDMIFNLPWSGFPFLFKCAPQLHYISGLDGMLLSQGDVDAFRVWYHLYRGELDLIDTKNVEATMTATKSSYILLEPGAEATRDWLLKKLEASKLVQDNKDGSLISLHSNGTSAEE